MPIILDHQLREQIPHKTTEFPVTYYHDELEELPNWAGPYHWHPNFEIATAERPANKSQVEISDFWERQKDNTKSSR